MNAMTKFNEGFIPAMLNEMMFGNMMPKARVNHTVPAMNVSESDTTYDVELAAPGMTKNDFAIRLTESDMLEVKMEKKTNVDDNKEAVEAKEPKYLRHEFSYESYSQTFSLPENVDLSAIKATMSDGILHITLPKKAEEPKQEKLIEIL